MVVSRLRGRAVRRASHDSTESRGAFVFHHYVEGRAPVRGGSAVAVWWLLVTKFFRRRTAEAVSNPPQKCSALA